MPIAADLDIATSVSCPKLGEILYHTKGNVRVAMLITKVLNKPGRKLACDNFIANINKNSKSIAEGFKFQMRNDNKYVCDYYIMPCIEKLVSNIHSKPELKGVDEIQFLWPEFRNDAREKIKNEPNKRIQNLSTLLRQAGFTLSQMGVSLIVVNQPDYHECQKLVCNAVTRSKQKQLEAEGPPSAVARPVLAANELDLVEIAEKQLKDDYMGSVIHCPAAGPNGFILDRFIYRIDVEPKILLKIDINDPRGNPVRTCIPILWFKMFYSFTMMIIHIREL